MGTTFLFGMIKSSDKGEGDSCRAHNQKPSQKGWETLHVKVKESKVAQSFLTLCDPME